MDELGHRWHGMVNPSQISERHLPKSPFLRIFIISIFFSHVAAHSLILSIASISSHNTHTRLLLSTVITHENYRQYELMFECVCVSEKFKFFFSQQAPFNCEQWQALERVREGCRMT
jgi:hypothetical protein